MGRGGEVLECYKKTVTFYAKKAGKTVFLASMLQMLQRLSGSYSLSLPLESGDILFPNLLAYKRVYMGVPFYILHIYQKYVRSSFHSNAL